MTVLSLFDGMGCMGIALKDMGYEFDYYTSEIDKHACKVSKLNFPDSVQLGDVTKWREWDLDWSSIDILAAGSPCQGFSFAGKQLAFDDPRSALFFVFVEIWQHLKACNPNALYLLENVKMKQEHELVISRYMGVHPIEINSALVSAQNRVRLYWTNIANEPYGLFGDMACTIPQPKDRGILLKDILEDGVSEKYYLSDKMMQWLTKHSEKRGTEFKKLDGNQKASCITTTEAKQNLTNDYICVASRGREAVLTPKRTEYAKEIRKEYESGKVKEQRKNLQQLEPRTDGKTNCLTSVQKDNLVIQINPSKESGGKQPYQQNRVYSECGKSPCLDTDFQRRNIHTQNRIRRLTPTECARLQTIPEWYKWGDTSDTQKYKMLGNGWTVEVIKHILKHANLKKTI